MLIHPPPNGRDAGDTPSGDDLQVRFVTHKGRKCEK